MTPFRVVAFGTEQIGRCKPRGFGFVVWNPDHTLEPGRLPGSGCFIWRGVHAARGAAMAIFDDPRVHQVQIRTNQDRALWIYNRHHDGRITGYNPQE